MEFGPMTMPAIIKPIMLGILNLLESNGEKRIIKSVRARISTGLLNGKYAFKK